MICVGAYVGRVGVVVCMMCMCMVVYDCVVVCDVSVVRVTCGVCVDATLLCEFSVACVWCDVCVCSVMQGLCFCDACVVLVVCRDCVCGLRVECFDIARACVCD